MSVALGQDAIVLSGNCGAEEAESLLALIQAHPGMAVDIAGVEWVHTALWQILIALGPPVRGVPLHGFIHDWILPLLAHDTSDRRAS
ncbi:hypothetical protein [Devosia submarina]|uniref:hypothetical protein n=1 Tax=Devosia submarina TaxID=1173082 RepID=UPI000D362E25|nr:hypothetical protein [Devosia submarina]